MIKFFGKQSGKAELQTPPPTPFPTCGRLPVAFPLEGRGAATALFAAWDSADTPLEGTTHYTHFAEKIRPQKPRRGDRIQAGVKQSETPAKACAAKALKGRRNTGRGKAPAKCCQHTTSPQACYNEACAPVLASLQSWGFTPARIPSPLRGCDAHPCAGVSPLPVFCHPFGVSAVEPYQTRGVEKVKTAGCLLNSQTHKLTNS